MSRDSVDQLPSAGELELDTGTNKMSDNSSPVLLNSIVYPIHEAVIVVERDHCATKESTKAW